VMQESMDK